MKLITLTAKSRTSIKCRGMVFDTRVYRCSIQYEDVTWGHSFFTSVTNPDLMPIIAGAPAIQMCLKFCQLSWLASKKVSTRVLISAAVLVANSVLQNQNSSCIFLALGKGDQVAFLSAIGRLVQLNASLERALLDFGANLPTHISSHVSNRGRTVSLESETCWIFFFAPDLIIISTMFSAHGLIISSAIVCGFLHFAIRYITS